MIHTIKYEDALETVKSTPLRIATSMSSRGNKSLSKVGKVFHVVIGAKVTAYTTLRVAVKKYNEAGNEG